MKAGEEINQKTFLQSPGTTIWELIQGGEWVGLGGGGEREERQE